MLRYVCIHGHFYQPPRENPYLDKIERQESAFPYHDWNERINDECYRPNTVSRILSEYGKIKEIVNNYEFLSFNIGPTLMSWIFEHDRDTYQRILQADKISLQKNNGHGNAIAQVYNHQIMPLADKKDRITQIRWGIDDFIHHFGRAPEGMWLAETAINMETVKDLVEHGIKFTILSPFQAEKIRSFYSNVWLDVSQGNIDPSQPYRIYTDASKEKYLDVFFYDAPISTAVSFEHILKSADGFAQRLDQAARPGDGRPLLINIATDGESYGHHEPFGDMCLAYFFKHLSLQYGFQIINYGAFLEKFPPINEVVLKVGENNEGTAWSCAHGVGRWKDDCGCSTGGQVGWNQKWRKPLREGLNYLRDELWKIFVKQTEPFFKDVLAARNNYYLLFSGKMTEHKWFSENLKVEADEQEKVLLLKMLESQKYAQLMFTSCGWFFADISGIETVQIIKYANKAIHLVKSYLEQDLEASFLKYLKEAISNYAPSHNGNIIYQSWIKPYELTPAKAFHQFITEGVVLDKLKSGTVYKYIVNIFEQKVLESDDCIFYLFNGETEHFVHHEKTALSAVLIKQGKNLTTLLATQTKNLENIFQDLQKINSKRLQIQLLKKEFKLELTMKDLNYEESSSLMEYLWNKRSKKMHKELNKIYNSFKDMLQDTVSMGGYLPQDIRVMIKMLLETEYLEALQKVNNWSSQELQPVIEVLDISKKLGLTLDNDKAKLYLQDLLLLKVQSIQHDASPAKIEEAIAFIKSLDSLNIVIKRAVAETMGYYLWQEHSADNDFQKLALMLNIEVKQKSH